MTETKLNDRVNIAIHMLTHLDVLFNNNEKGKQRPMHKSAKHRFSVVSSLCMCTYVAYD